MQNCTAVDEALRERLGLEQPAFVSQLLPQLMELVRASRRLPVGEEHAIRRGSKEFLSASQDLGQRSMATVLRLMRFLDPEIQASSPADVANFSLIEDSVDTVLERVDSCLRDALAGLSRASEAIAESESASVGGNSESPFAEKTLPKPQVRWRELVDNDRTEFVPRLMVKHNQKVPLSSSFLEAQRRAGLRAASTEQAGTAGAGNAGSTDVVNSALRAHLGALGVERNGDSRLVLGNPYEEEIRLLAYPDGLFETSKPQHFARMEDTPLVWVRTARELRALINEVKATCVGKEIAIDVEHHDFRSYRGFVCLVQLSTRQKDFLIDPFDIFDEMHWLNEIFTDPSILKVLHGSDRDVHWLQRDFSVYLVNMFDTGQATRSLKLQGGFSLANLVSHFCGIKLDKKYQTADWRQRPLSPEMAQYARCDTHYLLYCFDCLRNALLAGGQFKAGQLPEATADGVQAMRGVLDRSAQLCMTQYAEEPFNAADAAMRLCERFGSKQRPLETRQFGSLKALAAWRDALGRRLDESWNFVAPDACLWRIALSLPSTPARLRSTCNPLPALVQQHAQEVVDLVMKSAEAGTATNEVPDSPLLIAARDPPIVAPTSSLAQPQATLQRTSSSLSTVAEVATPTRRASISSNGTAVSMAESQVWPPSDCRDAPPIVRVTSGSLRHAANNGSEIKRAASLTSLFESESSADEDMDMDTDALRNLAPALEQVATQNFPKVPVNPVVAEVVSKPLPAAPNVVAAVGGDVTGHSNGNTEVKDEAETQSLREAYELPRAERRKKKKKKAQANAMGGTAAIAASTGASLEDEAAAFRAALAGALQGVDGNLPQTQQQAPPRPTKRKQADVSDPVASDPYAPAAATTVASTAVVSPAPKKKKKKIVRQEQPQPQADLVVDPYL